MNSPVQNEDAGGAKAGPTAHPLLEPADHSQYLLRSKAEIVYVLRGLVAGKDHITVYFNEGQNFLLSTVLQVDDNDVILDFGADPETNRLALIAEKLFCVTSHEKIRIQFVLRGLREINFQGASAFIGPLPDSILRLQRREYFRLTTPIVHPIKCQIPVSGDENAETVVMEANVIDISGGGLAMMVPPVGLSFTAGDVYENCQVELPEVGVVQTTLEVRNVFDVALRSGAQVTRAGCQFVNLPGPMLTLIQRYILKVERERKARESGLA
jgi:c-di-GMP-binding flagellar brake protein YcgR